jgi:hypothetical protein
MRRQHPDVVELQRRIESLESEHNTPVTSIHQDQAGTPYSVPFLNASHPTDSPSSAAEQIKDIAESIEIAPLREQLDKLQEYSESRAAQCETLADSIKSAGCESSGMVRYSIEEIHVQPAKPIGERPSPGWFTLLCVASLAIGAAVAWNFQPSMVDRGFASAHKVVAALGLPIVAEVPASEIERPSPRGRRMPTANRIVWCAEMLLFSMALLVITFCATQAEVRSDFVENPLTAMARIAWIVTGN